MLKKIYDNRLVVHLLLPALFAGCALCCTLIEAYDFKVNNWDYGLFSNMLWNFANGNGWYASLYAGQTREFFLADHLALLIPFLSLVYKIIPSPFTLSFLHGLAFASLFFLAPLLVREIFRHANRDDYLVPAFFMLLALWLFPGISSSWRVQTHMTTLAMPFVLLALICLHKGRLLSALFCCAILAMAQERGAVAVFGIGMYACLFLQMYKLGVSLCVSSLCYFFLAVKVLIPAFAGGTYLYDSNIQPLTDIRLKLLFLGKCCMGWFFLVALGKKPLLATLCAMPLIGIALISNRENMYTFSVYYQALTSVFLFVAATWGMVNFSKFYRNNKLFNIVIVLVVVCSIGIMHKDFLMKHPVYRLLTRNNLEAIQAVNGDLQKFTNIPKNLAVYASSSLGPRLSQRKNSLPLALDNSARAFQSAMVFVAPTLNMYPYTPEETAQILANLRDNPSLVPIMQNEHLHVYASKDINWP